MCLKLLHLFEIELIRFEGNNRVVVPNRPIDIKNFFLFIVFNYCQRFVYEALGISKQIPVTPLQTLLNVTPLKIALSAQWFIHFVCAQHEHVRTCLKALNKFVKYKFFIAINRCEHEIIPEGESPLRAEVTLRTVSKWQAGLPWGMQWRKPNGKLRYWRTETGYEA